MTTVDDLVEMSGELAEASSKNKLEALREELQPLVEDFNRFCEEKNKIELQLKDANKRIADQETAIRNIWGPHILGVDKASINFGQFVLASDRKLNVSVSDEEAARDHAVEWLKGNGYEECLKWDVNTNTMKAIAASELKEKEIKIPGLKYSYFNKLSVK